MCLCRILPGQDVDLSYATRSAGIYLCGIAAHQQMDLIYSVCSSCVLLRAVGACQKELRLCLADGEQNIRAACCFAVKQQVPTLVQADAIDSRDVLLETIATG